MLPSAIDSERDAASCALTIGRLWARGCMNDALRHEARGMSSDSPGRRPGTAAGFRETIGNIVA
jgi:hypothetical protein